MNTKILFAMAILLCGLSANALQATCDNDYRTIHNPHNGESELLLPGGGNSVYSSYHWTVMTESSSGDVEFSSDVEVIWDSEQKLTLVAPNRKFGHDGSVVTCKIKLGAHNRGYLDNLLNNSKPRKVPCCSDTGAKPCKWNC